MNKKDTRKPAAFKVEEIEVFAPPVPASSEPMPVPSPRLRTTADLGRGLRWGAILISALGALVSLLASIWLYDYVLALIARHDWIGWAAAALLALVVLALLMIVLREVAGLARLGRLGKIRHEADQASRQNDK
ncbi:MAG: hypothetical protein ABWZ94_04810, partial [Methyloceanibacter sp.]